MTNLETMLFAPLALRLFGSSFRGERDELSDLDVLLITDRKAGHANIGAILRHSDLLSDQDLTRGVDVSHYTAERYVSMHQNGHLFTWHIYRESCKLLDDCGIPDLVDRLGRPANPLGLREELVELLQLLRGISHSLHDPVCSLIYEGGLIFVGLRNIGITASWFVPPLCFSVEAPLRLSGRLKIDPPVSKRELSDLRSMRKVSTGVLDESREIVYSRKRLMELVHSCEQWAEKVLMSLETGK